VPHHPAEEVALSAVKRKVEFAPAVVAVRDEEHLEAAAWPVDEGVVSPGSCGGESCVTTEFEEDAASYSVAASAYDAAADTMRSVAPAASRERAFVERGLSLPAPPALSATDEHFDGADQDHGGDDDLDATWSAIMQRTRPATAPALSSSPREPRSSPPRARAREPSVGAAELSKRSDDFIKKIHHSFGRQQ
jgi:hypothetical protein